MEKKQPLNDVIIDKNTNAAVEEKSEKELQHDRDLAMLNAFFRIHDFLVAHSFMPIRRQLMDEIDWNDRLIAIKGGRGVGKTDFLLSRVKEIEEEWRNMPEPVEKSRRKKSQKDIRPCLYVSLNDFYFSDHTLMELPSVFVK